MSSAAQAQGAPQPLSDAIEKYGWYVAFRAVRNGPSETWPSYEETSRIANECAAFFRYLIPEAQVASQAVTDAERYQREVVEPNEKVYGADVEAARNVLKRYRRGQWHINGQIVREALDAAYAEINLDRLRGIAQRAKEAVDTFHLQSDPEVAMGVAMHILHHPKIGCPSCPGILAKAAVRSREAKSCPVCGGMCKGKGRHA